VFVLAGCSPPPLVRPAATTKIVVAAPPAPAALASEASGQRGHSMVRAPDTRPKPGSPARAAIPLPDDALLLPPQPPSCAFTNENGVDARAQLDYERQCYRHAEIIVRERLQALQAAIADTIRAVRRGE
jgi:hypothetical protein